VKGHRLLPGGLAYEETRKVVAATATGMAICQCGAHSAPLRSNIDRLAWHREHLADVLSGKADLL
jgi:hypothetical protein